MSTLTSSHARPVPLADSERRHRFWIRVCIIAAVALGVALAAYGFDYYTLAKGERAYSPKHALLKPTGSIGLRLGMLGFLLFLLVYLYPIRKRWAWLGKQGSSRHWLDFHVLLGLAAPLVITFHSSFKFHGLAGVAYWIMVAVALSGLIGRYIYAQIPRSLNATEMSLQEARERSARLADQLNRHMILSHKHLAPWLKFPEPNQVSALPLVSALWLMVRFDLALPFQAWRLRRRVLGLSAAPRSLTGLRRTDSLPLEQAIALAREQAALSKKILFLSKSQQLFHLWHVVHRPFSYSFALLATIHVVVALMLGYY